MKFRLTLLLAPLLIWLSAPVTAQITISNSAPYNNQEHLVKEVLLGTGVTAFDVTFNGVPAPTSANRIGFFDNTTSTTLGIGLDSGVVMTSGNLNGIAGPNLNGGNTSGPSNLNGSDPDLTALAGINSYNSAVLEFKFVPTSDTVKFRYVFGSEEYPEFVNQINDVFGFFVSGPGLSGPFTNNAVNIALIPGTTNPVTIDNVNHNTNSNFYIENGNHPPPFGADGSGNVANNPDIQFDGFTVPLEAVVAVNPCDTYQIKIAVADASDGLLDSGVFLEAKSFSASSVTMSAQTNYPGFGGDTMLYEGCGTHTFVFERFKNFSVQEVVHFDIIGDVSSADFGAFADSVVFAPNDTIKTITIDLLDDGITENPESMIFKLFPPNLSACDTSTATTINFTLLDRPPLTDTLTSFRGFCDQDSVDLVVDVLSGIPVFNYTWSTGATTDSQRIALPTTDSLFTVTVTDACGVDTLVDSLTIFNDYLPGMGHTIPDSFLIKCVEDSLLLEIQMASLSGVYGFRWHNLPQANDPTLLLTFPIQQGYYPYTIIDSCTATNDSLVDSVYIQWDLPQMDFSLNNTCTNVPVTLTDLSVQTDVPLASWAWDIFDDQVVNSTDSSFSTSFLSSGTYTVQLVVTDTQGCQDSISKPIIVHHDPVAQFSWDPVCFGDSMSFSDSSSVLNGNIINWSWDLGDSSPLDSTQNPTHLYADTGLFNVQLTVTSDSGCLNTSSQTVEVYKLPVAQFSFDPVCYQDTTPFYDQSTTASGSIVQWNWLYANGQTDTVQNPLHVLSSDDTLSVQLAVSSSVGCVDTVTQSVFAYKLPVVDFDFDNICQFQSAVFLDSSQTGNGSPLVSRQWDLGDNDTIDGTLQSFSSAFNNYGSFPIELLVTDSLGCSDSLVQQLVVSPKPEAGFVFINVCVGQPVNFFDTSTVATGSNTEWFWDFGNSSIPDSSQNSTYSYDSAGFYTVTFIVTSDSGCSDTTSGQIQLVAFPFPSSDFDFTLECLGDTTFFTDLSTLPFGTIDSAYWHFGEGTAQSFDLNATHVYSNYGSYEVTHFAITDNGCATLSSDTVDVYERPAVNFDFGNVCLNDSMFFTNQSSMTSNTIDAWWWDAGDGSALATTEDYQHLFASADTFQVQLKARADSTGCLDSLQQAVTVYALPDVSFLAANVCADSVVTLTDQTQAPNLAPQSEWYWDVLNDGSIEYLAQDTQHVFSTAGTYPIELRTVDTLGCTDSTVQSIVIHPNPIPAFSVNSVCAGTANSFTDQSTVSSGAITSWSWDFGDNSALNTAINPAHLYAVADTYQVSLTVVTDSGCAATTALQDAVVFPSPSANFNYTSLCSYDSLPMMDASTITPAYGQITSWNWDFGDGSANVTIPDPKHRFSQYGYFQVNLTVGTPNGCTDTITQLVQVYEVPKARFINSLICQDALFSLEDQTTINTSTITDRIWDFGDGQKLSTTNPMYRYTTTDSFDISLTATTAQGCIDSVSRRVAAYPKPEAAFEYELGCANKPIKFTNQSTVSPGRIDSSRWSFGYPTPTVPRFNTEHLFPGGGTYTVGLQVRSEAGCRDTAVRQVEVLHVPNIDFDILPDNGCAPLEVSFQNKSTFAEGFDLTYEWRIGADSFTYTSEDLNYTFLNRSGEIEYEDVYLKVSSPLCHSQVRLKDTIEVLPQPIADFKADPPAITVFDGTINFEDQSFDALYREWEFGDGNGTYQDLEPSNTYLDPGWYRVKLSVENQFSCIDTTSRMIHIKPEATFWVPKAFTPNGDGLNDFFFAQGEGIDNDFTLRVFTRWGELIYSGAGLDARWNGLMDNGQPAPQGTYVYRITYIDLVNMREVDTSDSFSLVRNRP